MSTDVPTEADGAKGPGRRSTAEAMASKQRDISVSEFFTKNRHLLGFDNPQKALLTAVKEAVDNSLDACEEAGIAPSIRVAIEELSEGRFRVTVEDNGPGIVKAQIPKIFAKLLYGSKFHRLKQSRGQQGIGISAAGMYGQLTTGRPVVVTSKTGRGRPAYRLEIRIDARSNAPEVLKDDVVPWEKEHGTMVSIEMSGLYRAGRASVASYLEQTVVANPHLELTFEPPRGERVHFPRASEQLPPETQEIKPHPYGVELGMLIKSFQESGERTAKQVLMEDYSRVTGPVALELLKKADVPAESRASRLDGPQIERIHQVIQVSQVTIPVPARLFKQLQKREDKFVAALAELGTNFTPSLVDALSRRAGIEPTVLAKKVELSQLERFHAALENLQVRILPPPATCVAPIGEELIIEGLKRRFAADFYTSHTRPPAVYRGNPFVVEVGIAYGGALPSDQGAEVLRFANRVPLLYQPRACATTEAVVRVNWKSYAKEGGLNQRGSELPVGPLAVLVHLASVWVPFTNEAKEAIAGYDEIIEEIRAALMECGRKLGSYVNAQAADRLQRERKSLFEKYIEEISAAIGEITGFSKEQVKSEFHAALPRFVKLHEPKSDEGGPPEGAGGAAASVASIPPPEQRDSGEFEAATENTVSTARVEAAAPPREKPAEKAARAGSHAKGAVPGEQGGALSDLRAESRARAEAIARGAGVARARPRSHETPADDEREREVTDEAKAAGRGAKGAADGPGVRAKKNASTKFVAGTRKRAAGGRPTPTASKTKGSASTRKVRR